MLHSDPEALVTGGSRGIGRAICVELARNGYAVAINYAGNEKAARETANLVDGSAGFRFAAGCRRRRKK